MKYKAPQVAGIFFMTSFNRDGGGHGCEADFIIFIILLNLFG